VPPAKVGVSFKFIMALSDYFSSKFLFIATANVFNVIALISAILLLLSPIVFVAHTGYNFYHFQKAEKIPPQQTGRRAEVNPYRHPPYTAWWKWYVVTGIIHLLDAWFFRTFMPFLERARSGIETPAKDLGDLIDIARLLWGIVRALSIVVIAVEILEKRLILETVSLAPMIVAISFSPVALYWLLLATWNSTGFLWGVIVDAFKPDWRTGQDVFAPSNTAEIITAMEAPKPPQWRIWGR